MTRYMIEAISTPQNMANLLKDSVDRTEAIRQIIEAAGGSFEQYYNNFSEGITFTIVNFPDEMGISSIMAALFAGEGLSSVRALPILTAAESVAVFKKAAGLGYRPPGK